MISPLVNLPRTTTAGLDVLSSTRLSRIPGHRTSASVSICSMLLLCNVCLVFGPKLVLQPVGPHDFLLPDRTGIGKFRQRPIRNSPFVNDGKCTVAERRHTFHRMHSSITESCYDRDCGLFPSTEFHLLSSLIAAKFV